jgi:hypothetical protein
VGRLRQLPTVDYAAYHAGTQRMNKESDRLKASTAEMARNMCMYSYCIELYAMAMVSSKQGGDRLALTFLPSGLSHIFDLLALSRP